MWKKIRYTVVLLMALTLSTFAYYGKVKASEEIKANQLINIGTDTDVMESTEDDSKIVGSLTEGTSVIALETPDNGWVKIKYQSIIGYVRLTAIAGQDTVELDQEFDQISNDNRIIFQAMEYNNSQDRQNLIWGIIIGGLVIALFAVGIVTGVNNSKKGKK